MPSKNTKQKCRTITSVAVCAARCTGIVLLPRHLSSLEFCPSTPSQAPLRYWFGSRFPLVLANWLASEHSRLSRQPAKKPFTTPRLSLDLEPIDRLKGLKPFHSQEWSFSNFPCSLTRNITSHSMKNALVFHSLLRWKMITLPILTTSLTCFSLKRW